MAPRIQAAAFADAPGFGLPFREAIDYLRQKINLPSLTWRDILGRSHDRSFVVAGAMKEGLLADLRAEMEKAVAGQSTLAMFRKEFDQIVARNGWTGWTGEGTEAGRAWRTRVIYETNMRTAYAAGRYAQMTDPDIVKVYKWWRYRHAYYREPVRARPEHRDIFDGTVLPWNHPWWNTHYPPNGWNCSCGVETLSDREAEAEGIEPGEAPPVTTRTVIDPKTGARVEVPNGIDFGWDHAPGRDWARGIVPRELQLPLAPLGAPDTRSAIVEAAMPPARPFTAPQLAPGGTAEDYVEAFLDAFGARIGSPMLFRDPSGHALPISDQLFRTAAGDWKVAKRGRELDVLRLAETIRDPDEIWLSWWRVSATDTPLLFRSYIRRDAATNGFAMFRWSNQGWTGETAFGADKARYLIGQRRGSLLYRRGE